ncbi:Hpt domain-containing protein [Arthrobacter sp. R1-13]
MYISGPQSGDRGRDTALPASSAGRFRASPSLEGGEPRWIESAVLDDLEAQMGSRDIVVRFAHDYAQLWVQRHHSLMTAIERQDHQAALDAVLSLKNSSGMVGGLRLAGLAETLEAAIRMGEVGDMGQELLEAVTRQGQATVNELQHNYLRDNPAGVHALKDDSRL